MAHGTPDWQISVGRQDEPVPQTTTSTANYSFGISVPANSTGSFEIIPNTIIAAYRCYLVQMLISCNDDATVQNWYLLETFNSYSPFGQYLKQTQTHNLGKYEVPNQAGQAMRLYLTNNHPTLARTFNGTLQYTVVLR